jgi:hypothetical protein
MKKISKPLFREQIPEIINKLAQIDQNSPDSIFIHYYHGSWSADVHIGGYDANKESVDLIKDDYKGMSDKDRKAAYSKAVDYIKKNEGKSICFMNLKTGDKVYFNNKKAIVGTIKEGITDFYIVDTGETRSLLGFDKDDTYFKTWL